MIMGQVASRFGQDAPARIVASANVLSEQTAYLPGEPVYPGVIPFYQGNVVSGAAAATPATDGPQSWERLPTRLDIKFRQGDDVVIPLYLQDPENPALDMSTWEWHSQIRTLPYYTRTLVNEFTTDASFYPPGTYDPTLGTTLVQLFLPRELNDYWGTYYWELYSIGPYSFAQFPKPPDWDDADVWPPTTSLRTWLCGVCTIRPRITDTDVLPDEVEEVPPPDGGTNPVFAPGYFVGPNGRYV